METVQLHLFKARVGGGNRYFLIKERSIYQIKVVAILYYESPPSAISRPLLQICFSTICLLSDQAEIVSLIIYKNVDTHHASFS